MVSGLVILSEPDKMCYPWREAIASFLPAVDEMVIVWNTLEKEGRDEAAKLDSKVRLVQSAFDLRRFGWVSYGLMRTTGYQAAHGDIVMMFDADGVLHESETDTLRQRLAQMQNENIIHAYWEKYRFYKPTVYYHQHKHSGIYNKKILGDKFDFFGLHLGTPNWEFYPNIKSWNTGIHMYGYEHIWDNFEVFEEKVNRYGIMRDLSYNQQLHSKQHYISDYVKELKDKVNKDGLSMAIEVQPKVIQGKLKSVNDSMFGFDFFAKRYGWLSNTG